MHQPSPKLLKDVAHTFARYGFPDFQSKLRYNKNMSIPTKFRLRINTTDKKDERPYILEARNSIDMVKSLHAWLDCYISRLANEENPYRWYLSILPLIDVDEGDLFANPETK